MDIALANILYRACGFDPHSNIVLSRQDVSERQAVAIAGEIRGEYGVQLTAATILGLTPDQLQRELP